MSRWSGIRMVLPVLGLLVAGCAVGPANYQGPAKADQNAATVTAGAVAETYSVSHGSSWISIVAVDGVSSGLAPAVSVTPGEHRYTVRHFDPYATFYGNVRHESIAFRAEPDSHYRIDASYCCGFILGQFKVYVTDVGTGQQVAAGIVDQQ